ncbi:MAG: hypothetical protein QFX32_06585 [Methanolinea sp.]|nr:hypothetical protein [Methanolinea sp.]
MERPDTAAVGSARIFALFALALVSLAVPAASLSITARPEAIQNGHPVTVEITGLPDGARFSLLVESVYSVSPNTEFYFQMSQFEMPFTLAKGNITATLEGTSQNRLEVRKGDTIVAVSGKSTDGRFTTTKTHDVTAGTYDYFRLSGTTLPTARTIVARFQVTGTKKGPENSRIWFVVDGLPSGTVTVAAVVDGAEVLHKKIPVGTGNAPATNGTASFSSADGVVSVRVPEGTSVSVLSVPGQGVRGDFHVLAGPYAIVPYEAVLSPAGEITFALRGAPQARNPVVAILSGGNWTLLPSAVAGSSVTAPAGTGGIYALVEPVGGILVKSPAPETTPPTTTVTTRETHPPATPTPAQGAGPTPLALALAVAGGFLTAARLSRRPP